MNITTAIRRIYSGSTFNIDPRGSIVVRRVVSVLASLGLAAGLIAISATSSTAAVRDGDGNADEYVYCNSATHTIQITTWSQGLMTGQIVGSDLFPRYQTTRVWLRMQKIVNGKSVFLTNWNEVLDGTHSATINAPAGETSYWYFMWAFQRPTGEIDYMNEWARGLGSYGWYANQQGFQSLTSCRT